MKARAVAHDGRVRLERTQVRSSTLISFSNLTAHILWRALCFTRCVKVLVSHVEDRQSMEVCAVAHDSRIRLERVHVRSRTLFFELDSTHIVKGLVLGRLSCFREYFEYIYEHTPSVSSYYQHTTYTTHAWPQSSVITHTLMDDVCVKVWKLYQYHTSHYLILGMHVKLNNSNHM